MRFVYPWILTGLLLLPVVGLLGFWMLSLGGRRLAGFVSPEMQARLAPPRRQALVGIQVAAMLAGLVLLVLAAARPQWGRAEVRVQAKGRNLLIALDVSRSMLAADVHPNRLERAKADIMDLLEDLRGDRAGLLVFRGKANMLCPLTTDRAFLRQALDGVSIDAAPRGETDLADAIQKSLDALASAFDQNNAILLITDGEDLAGRAQEAARRAAQRGIPIFTVGIGDPKGAAVPGADGGGSLQFQGQPVVTRMDEGTLEAIAKTSGGTYIPLATSGTASTTLGAIYRQHLTRVAAREYEEQLERRYIERYQLFLIPAVLLLLATAMLSRGRMAGGRKTPGQPIPPPVPRAVVLTLALVFACGGSTVAQTATNRPAAMESRDANGAARSDTNAPALALGREGARLAQKLYKRGRYAESAEAYLAAARGAEPAEANRYRYNAALSRYKGGDMAQAAETVRPLTMIAGQGAAAELYGAASFKEAAGEAAATNATLRAAVLQQAGAGFQQALRGAPEDARMHRNLDRALNGLPAVREAAHIEQVLAEHGQTPPESLIATMLQEQRSLLKEAPVSFTNRNAEQMIRELEAMGERERTSSDLWIPLKRALVESNAITNEQQRAMVAERIEQTRDGMKRAARRLADLDGEGVGDVARSEASAYAFWQMLAAPPGLVGEAIQAQTNAWARPQAPRFPHRPDQPDAAQLAQLFKMRFGPWADQVQQQAQADTNAPSLTPEAREEIEQLTDETVKLHEQILEAEKTGKGNLDDVRYQALKNLVRIRELLPKDKQQQNQQQQQQQQQQQEQKPEEQQPEEQEQKEEPSGEKPDEPPPEVQEVLRRALQREKEHEADKRRQMREFPMAPGARDW